MGLRIDGHPREILASRAHLTRQRIDLAQRVDLIPPHLDAVGLVLVGGIDFDHIAARAECSAPQLFAALVLDIHEPPQQRLARRLLPFFQHYQHAVVGLRRTQAIDAGDGSHDDDVAPLEERPRRAHAQFVELVVDRGFFFNVQVRRRHIRFRLVVVVVTDKIFHGVFGKEALELVVELRRKRLVVRQHERGAVCRVDEFRDGKRFARTGHSQQHLMLLTGFDATD